jgi:hypothetical protein
MVAHAPRSWLTQALGLMPTRLLKALDAWSYRIAQKRAQQRRLAAQPRTQAAAVEYKLKPWRD